MNKVPYQIVEGILLGLPKASKIDWLSQGSKTYFDIDDIVVAVPSDGIAASHLGDILNDQIGMSWWMIDYIFGQNGIQP